MKKVKVTGIKWDADNMNDVEGIPADMTINIPEHINLGDSDELEEFISDELSNQSGFTHDGWSDYELISDNTKFEKIYKLLNNASAIMVDGRVTNDWSLEEKDEILQEVAEDENPIVISIYGATLDDGRSFYVPLEYYFDYRDLCDAQIESDHLIMKAESGASVSVYVFTNATSISDESQKEEMALQYEENGTDFILTGDRCYITVNNLTVLVSKGDESVTVDVFPMQQEDGDPVESIVFPYPEGEDDSDEDSEKAYCLSCKMDMHYDEIGNCKGCGNFIDGGAV